MLGSGRLAGTGPLINLILEKDIFLYPTRYLVVFPSSKSSDSNSLDNPAEQGNPGFNFIFEYRKSDFEFTYCQFNVLSDTSLDLIGPTRCCINTCPSRRSFHSRLSISPRETSLMTRGRKKDLTIPPTRALAQQRDYRARKARYLAELEEHCRRVEQENALLKQEIESLKAGLPFTAPDSSVDPQLVSTPCYIPTY